MSNKLNLELKQGEDFYRLLTFRDENAALMDLTGYTFAGQIRASYDDELFLSFTFSVLNQTTNRGEVEMTLAKALSSAKTVNGKNKYVYDVERNSGTRTVRVLEGVITISPEVTK
jgi:hypothetical protein